MRRTSRRLAIIALAAALLAPAAAWRDDGPVLVMPACRSDSLTCPVAIDPSVFKDDKGEMLITVEKEPARAAAFDYVRVKIPALGINDKLSDYLIVVPSTHAGIFPILVSIPLQLLAYHLAVLRGCNIDQPRNLAKSVTVE